MAYRDVRFLNVLRRFCCYDQSQVDGLGQLAAASPGKPYGGYAERASRATARSTFTELPLVDMAIATSPARPSARNCRSNSSSNEESFPIEVSIEVSVVSAMAG